MAIASISTRALRGNPAAATVARAGSARLAGGIANQMAAQAELEDMGATYGYPDPASKATLGDTDAALA